MFLLQFSGQGAITFYTVQIFTVSIHYTDNLYKPSRCVSADTFVRTNVRYLDILLDTSPQDACSQISPKDCALTIGVTYFLSALLSLVLKNLIGRRVLMLISLLGEIQRIIDIT